MHDKTIPMSETLCREVESIALEKYREAEAAGCMTHEPRRGGMVRHANLVDPHQEMYHGVTAQQQSTVVASSSSPNIITTTIAEGVTVPCDSRKVILGKEGRATLGLTRELIEVGEEVLAELRDSLHSSEPFDRDDLGALEGLSQISLADDVLARMIKERTELVSLQDLSFNLLRSGVFSRPSYCSVENIPSMPGNPGIDKAISANFVSEESMIVGIVSSLISTKGEDGRPSWHTDFIKLSLMFDYPRMITTKKGDIFVDDDVRLELSVFGNDVYDMSGNAPNPLKDESVAMLSYAMGSATLLAQSKF